MAVLNKHHGNIPKDAIYIGRGSMWGNPYVIGKDGSRDEVCDKHLHDLMEKINEGEIRLPDLAYLHGKDLVCFCAPKRCHGDALQEFAAQAHQHLQDNPPVPGIGED